MKLIYRHLIMPLFLVFISSFSFSQWNSNPAINTALCVQPYDQQDVRIISDDKGGAIVTWLDFRHDATQASGDIFVQRIDKNGFTKWTVNGVGICTLSSDQTAPYLKEDGQSGAFLVWNDWRNGNRDIYAQRIDSSGNVMWASNGTPVVVKTGHQQDARMVADGIGGVIIVWQDSSSASGWDIYAQRLNANGAPQWAASGVAICTASNSQINPKIETDGSGGAIIVWQDKRNGIDYDIYAQRINGAGVIQWTTNGVFICSVANTAQINPKLRSDGNGGAIIAWQDKRNGTDYDIYVQRVNASGTMQWATNGVVVCNAVGNQSAIDIALDIATTSVILFWKDARNGQEDIYAQRINFNGTPLWTTNGIGIATSPAPQINPNAILDGNGGAIVVWQDSTNGTWDIYSQRIDAAGNLLWGTAGTMVGTASGNQTSPKNVSDGNGGSIYAWQDKRSGNFDVYAHHLYANGTTNGMDENNFPLSSKCFPNPFTETAFISIGDPRISTDDMKLKIYDICGKKVNIKITPLKNGFKVFAKNFSDGIYFYEIIFKEKIMSSGKFIVSKEQ